ncbi:MAG: secretin N-terminal domain-containing protein [Phycisphaerae bacterium]
MINSGFKPGVAISAVLCCAFALGAGEAPPGPKEAGKPPLVSNVFIDTDLRQALQDIASQVGVIIVPDESVSGLVTCELKDVPLDKALEIVLAGTGYVVKKTPDYYLVCSSDPKSASFALISETRLLKLDYAKAATAAKLLSPGFRDCVQADAESNAVCITAPPSLMERIVSDLKLIDQPPRHIMLNARIVVIEQSDLLELGIDWTWPQIQMGTFSSSAYHGGGARPNWPWGIEIGYTPGAEFTNALGLALNLLEQNDEATVVSNPQVMAQDGKEAEIKVNTEEYFQIVTEGYYTRTDLEKIETGTILKITPRIGENNDITLEMETEVSDVIARGEDNLPVVTRRTAKNTVRIQNGGTAVVAGLMDSRTRLSDSRAPGLADIPWLGGLWRSREDSKSSRQVAVFVTARLIPEEPPRPVEPVAKRPRIEPVGEEFKAALRESLLRLGGGNQSR